MEVIFEVIKSIVLVFLSAVQLAMLIRAIMSWFMFDENKFLNFLYAITEPFIIPIRALFAKMNWFQNSPIDFSFMISYLLISMLTIFLP